MPTDFKAFKITIGDFEEDINLRGTTSFSLIKTPFAYKQIKAKQRSLHKYTLFKKFVKRFADFIENNFEGITPIMRS